MNTEVLFRIRDLALARSRALALALPIAALTGTVFTGTVITGIVFTGSAVAATPAQWTDPGLSATALEMANGSSLQVEGLPIFPGEATVKLDLEKFRVWKAGAEITIHGAEGVERRKPAERGFFRGQLAGEDGSFVFASVDPAGGWRSLVVARDRMFVLARDPGSSAPGANPSATSNSTTETPRQATAQNRTSIREVDPSTDLAEALADWTCATDTIKSISSPLLQLERQLKTQLQDSAALAPQTSSKALGGTLAGDLAVETDWEFFNLLGSETAASDYVADLVGAVTAIFLRDINTMVQISDLFLYTEGAQQDPWTGTDVVTAVFEVRDYWLANRTDVDRSLVNFITGKSMGGGVAFVGSLCDPVLGYGVSAGIGGDFDPDNPTMIGDLYVFAHELGHTFGSPHTHCYGGYPSAGDPPIDMCWGSEMDCYDGTTSVPVDGGSIMSYCSLQPGGNINLWLGREGFYGVQSERINTRMRDYIESVSSCLPQIVDPVFSDGFESGDASSWTLSVGSN